MREKARNVLGASWPTAPSALTGFFRDGCCNTSDEDRGSTPFAC